MPRVTPDDLRLTIGIWLRFAPQAARVAFASKHVEERDKGSTELARTVCDRLARTGWTVENPNTPGVQRDFSPDMTGPAAALGEPPRKP